MARQESLGASGRSAGLAVGISSFWLPNPLLDGIAVFGNLWLQYDQTLSPRLQPNSSSESLTRQE